MTKNILRSILVIVSLMVATPAKADGIVFNPSFFYFVDKTDSGTSTKDTYQIINLKLGYLMFEGIYLGLNYDMDDKEVVTTNTANYHRKSYGPTIGYISNGWQILGTYFLKSDYDANGADYEGKGYAIELGYIFNVSSVGLGPLLSYRSWTYDKLNGQTLTTKYKQTNIIPSIQLSFTF